MRAVDTNVVLRALLDDDPVQSPLAEALLSSGERFLLCETVLLEIAWVLRGHAMTKHAVAAVLRDLVASPAFATRDPDAIGQAIALIEAGGDAGDALHLATAHDADAIVTFDDDFVKRAKRAKLRPPVVLVE